MQNEKIFLGLDIGTDSVGWAVTNNEYKLKKYKGNLMWGVSLFEAASQASERRLFRTARRRLDRKKQRIILLQEFFCKEIAKIDDKFFFRLKESALFPEDSNNRKHNTFFEDDGFTDKEYYEMYPTIHHLIVELMNNPKPHDVRLVYLACAYILGHRGHFLSEVDKNKINDVLDFSALADNFYKWFESCSVDRPFGCENDTFENILKLKKGVTYKENEFKNKVFGGKKITTPNDYPVDVSVLVKLICGGTIQLSKLFNNNEYESLENNSVSVASADFPDKLETIGGMLEDGDADLLLAVKNIHDWSVLVDILKEKTMISEAKIEDYNIHKNDLKNLKYLCKKYLTKNEYYEIFRLENDNPNYVKYSKNVKNAVETKKIVKLSKASQEDFCKFVKKYVERIAPDETDKTIFDEISEKLTNNALCPKQVTTDNRVIPYQLYYVELKKILENASGYLDFLNEKDEYGTVADKILSIMEFKIPYYVGPLKTNDENDLKKNYWMVRQQEGKIYPWNFEEKVDLDESENRFIRRMTCTCTYMAGEDVLPKYSLLYCKFNVLNEINNIRINDIKISVKAKQSLFEEVFMKEKKVTVKKIKNHLTTIGVFADGDILSGIDVNVKSSLKSYVDFKRLLEAGIITEFDVEEIIKRLTISTDIHRTKRWIKNTYPQIKDEDITYISKLNYKDYGRLSEKLLTELYEVDEKTGETNGKNIITRLWETNDNFMQLLSENYGYNKQIEINNDVYYSNNPKTLDEKLKDMYIPNAVRRSVMRTLDIVNEIKKLLPQEPSKIFIEMARGEGETPKGKRTQSRKDKLKEQLKLAKKLLTEDEWNTLNIRLESMSDGDLRSEKYYLYFNQLGRCMYSNKPIIFEELGNNKNYDIDHIIPQSKLKDDSIDNKVLVLSEENGKKSDKYPVSSEIRKNMSNFWKYLYDKEIITEKKYQRLTRTTNLTEEELAGFINRQLVETRQSTKAVAQLLGEMFPDAEIVYVKAGIVSEYRHKCDMLKCRDINDLHHAKDAYLNIVMGNVYNIKFTKDPLNFVKNGNEKYTLKLFDKNQDGKTSGILSRVVERNGEKAWDPDVSFDMVSKMMEKNSIRYVRYTFKKKGGLFDQMPLRADEGLVELKKGKDTAKYGGYQKPASSHFALVKCEGIGAVIIPVRLMISDKYLKDKDFAKSYAYETLENILSTKEYSKICENDISFPLGNRIIKVNTLLEIDGFRVNMCATLNKGKNVKITSAVPLVCDKIHHDYIKRLSSFSEKRKNISGLKVSVYDKITSGENLEIYDMYAEKCLSKPFSNYKTFNDAGMALMDLRDNFIELSVDKQVTVLMNIISILKTGRKNFCDLTAIKGKANMFSTSINAVIPSNSIYKDMRIIDQSPTGLIEKKSENLLEI